MTLKLKIEMHYSRWQLVEEKHRCKECCPLRRFYRGVIGRENNFFSLLQKWKRQVSEKIIVQDRSCRGVYEQGISEMFKCIYMQYGWMRRKKKGGWRPSVKQFSFLSFSFFFFSAFLSQSICCKLDLEKHALTSSSVANLLGRFSIFIYYNPW